MGRILPSLDLIRGFEAAARNLSFTAAADELFVTQSAVSRQIQALEEHLGVSLFERRHRSIVLTESGQMLFRSASSALHQLEETATRIQQQPSAKGVTVSCTISFASLWLVPRLAEFREKHPDIDLRISANNTILDLERERIEVAVRYCPPQRAPAGAIRLFGEEGFPVCSPALLNKPGKPLVVPEDLQHHILLHLDGNANRRPTTAWLVWLEVVHLPNLKPAGSLHFSHYDQLIQAAADGQGVALGVTPLVRRLLSEGRLVAPFEQRLASPRAYYLITSKDSAARSEVRDLVAWMTKSARAG